MAGRLEVRDLGTDVDYAAAAALQQECHAGRCAGTRDDTLLLLEHVPVYTLGRSAKPENIRWDDDALRAAGIACVTTTRGGDVTYHGPGQLVGYPIIHLAQRGMGVLEYIQAVEESLIRALAACGLAGAGRDARNRGVWVGNDKIAAIGIRVSHQVTAHGFALNVNTRLADYAGIVPCGLTDAGVTSLARCLGRAADMDAVKRQVIAAFGAVFGYDDVVWAAASPFHPQGLP
jgi:lipoate-protein ligase B